MIHVTGNSHLIASKHTECMDFIVWFMKKSSKSTSEDIYIYIYICKTCRLDFIWKLPIYITQILQSICKSFDPSSTRLSHTIQHLNISYLESRYLATKSVLTSMWLGSDVKPLDLMWIVFASTQIFERLQWGMGIYINWHLSMTGEITRPKK